MKILVVDGYNVIHRIKFLSDIADKNLKEARDVLSRYVNRYKKKDGGISEVYIVFDGQNKYKDLDVSMPKSHIFSNTGEGDKKIIDTIKKYSKKGRVVVVSDDNYVCNNARAYKAGIKRPKDLFK